MLDDRSVRLALADALAEEQGERFFQARLRTMVSKGENPGALAGMIKLAYAGRQQKVLGLQPASDEEKMLYQRLRPSRPSDRRSCPAPHGG